jgi:hypothetical protein
MEKEKSTFDTIIEDAQQYFNAKQELATLKIAEKSSRAVSAAAAGIMIFILALIMMLFASISLGFALTNYFGSASIGFLGVAGIYLVLLLLLLANKEKWIINPIINTMVKNFFKDHDGKN